MNRIAMIYPYFGKLPDFFYVWMMTAGFNTDYDFYVFTDCEVSSSVPDNFTIINMSFHEFRLFIQKDFDFEISLEKPYKICDYRPAFGEVFRNYLKGYDFWGYGDVDVICGEFNRFVTQQDLLKYDRISQYGHFSLYRNTERMRQLYKTLINGKLAYKIVFSNPDNCTFDEFWNEYGIEDIAVQLQVNEKRDLQFAGVERPYRRKKLCYKFDVNNVALSENENRVFHWEKGRLYGIIINMQDYSISTKEYAYVHFQKRKIGVESISSIKKKDDIPFWVVPNRIMTGTLEDVVTYLSSDEYLEEYALEQNRFREFRSKYPDVF